MNNVRRWQSLSRAAWLVTVPAVVGLTPPAAAQQMTATRLAERSERSERETTARTSSDVMTRLVTVTLDGVSLAQALATVATSADVSIQYKVDVVRTVNASVSVRAVKLPLGVVLERILAGTNLQAVPYADDIVTVRPSVVAAVAQGTITGKVINAKTKRPIVGATVLLDDAPNGVLTGEDGGYRLPASAGQHQVTVRAIGVLKQSRQVTVTDNQTTTLDFSLEPSASVLDEVVVTGTVVATARKAVPTPITVITAADIEKRGITRVDQLFRGEVPGVLSLDQGSKVWDDFLGNSSKATVYARGAGNVNGGANPLKTYINGVELLDPTYLGTIDPASIERIEIITGPQAATLYGSGAIGGVMQIFTKRGNGRSAPDLTLNLRYGMLENNTNDALTPRHDHTLLISGGSGPEFSYSVDGSYQSQAPWQPALYSRGAGISLGVTHTRGPLTASGSYSVRGTENGTQGVQSSSPCGALTCGSTPYSRELYEDGDLRFSNGFALVSFSQRVSKAMSQTASFNADYRLLSFWQHHLTVGRSATTMEITPERPTFVKPGDSLFYSTSTSGQRTTASYNMTFSPSVGFLTSTVILGSNGSWGSETMIDGCLTSRKSGINVACGNPGGPTVSKLEPGNSWGGFGSLQLGFFQRAFLSYGIRGERNPNYGSERKVDWTPTAGATATMDIGELTVKALMSYGRATRAPLNGYRDEKSYTYADISPSTIVTQVAAPNLRPEYSRGPQGGIELYYGNLGSLTINHYQQTITDLIQQAVVDSVFTIWVPDPTSTWYTQQMQYQNTAKIRQRGWDGTASITLGGLNIKGTYSWFDSRVLAVNPEAQGASNVKVGEVFATLPTHSGNIVVNYARGGSSVTLVSNYVGAAFSGGSQWSPWAWRMSNARLKMYNERFWLPIEGVVASGYVKSDVLFSQRLTRWASATVNILNVSNSYTSDVGMMWPTLGRTTTLGLSLRNPR